MGGAPSRRYIEGKKPSIYFASNVWIEHKDLLEKLGLGYKKSLSLFEIYCKIDTDNSGTINKEEFYNYVGGYKTLFSLRIFDAIKVIGKYDEGSYLYFVLCVWHFCSLDASKIARYIFEVFDPDNKLLIRVPDLEAIYKYLYDCEDHDVKYIKRVPVSEDGTISKSNFIKHFTSCSHVIQPALDFRQRLAAKCGGKLLWNSVTSYRIKWFSPFDNTIDTLEESIISIIASEDRNKYSRRSSEKHGAEEIMRSELEDRRRSVRQSLNFVNSVKEAANKAVAVVDVNSNEGSAERILKAKMVTLVPFEYRDPEFWTVFEDLLDEYEDKVFTTDEIWDMHVFRGRAYDEYESAVAAEEKYWNEKEKDEMLLTVGVEDDHILRYDDYMKTVEGESEYSRLYIMHTLRIMLENIHMQHEKKGGKLFNKKSAKDIELATGLININKLNAAVEKREVERKAALESGVSAASIKIVPKETKVTVTQLKQLINKYATKAELTAGAFKAKRNVIVNLKDRAITSKEDALSRGRKTRLVNKTNKLQALQEVWGAKISRWYLALDATTQQMIYVNIDTLEVHVALIFIHIGNLKA